MKDKKTKTTPQPLELAVYDPVYDNDGFNRGECGGELLWLK